MERSSRSPGDDFRWQAFFQRSTDPLFLLNRQRLLLFVNRAWEKFVGLSASQVKRMACRDAHGTGPLNSWLAVLAHALCPPAECLEGTPLRCRRLIPALEGSAPKWWDVDFFPFLDEKGFRGVLGRITPVPALQPRPGIKLPPLPEKVVALRENRLRRFRAPFTISRMPALRRIAAQVRTAAQVTAPVLLVGPPGSGKKTLAGLIHYQGPSKEKALAILDCERLPAFAVASLLFGETGATARSPVGSVYLREPAALPRELQRHLGLALLGSSQVDLSAPLPRILAGTTRDPVEDVKAGRLLEDLFHALSALRIDVPALSTQRDDFPFLVDRQLQRLNADGRPPLTSLTADAWEVLLGYSWPGNLRELWRVLASARDHALARPGAEAIDAQDLPAHVRRCVQLSQMPAQRPERGLPLEQILEQVERHLIRMALSRSRGNKTRAAEMLSLWRPRLIRRMEALQIEDTREEE